MECSAASASASAGRRRVRSDARTHRAILARRARFRSASSQSLHARRGIAEGGERVARRAPDAGLSPRSLRRDAGTGTPSSRGSRACAAAVPARHDCRTGEPAVAARFASV
ncbi:hypothetical protein BURMUCF2_2305 [Burkholderia multivorans CF2]|nr:hypothetical protein BURMUCF2_2305 [Burkholderia multivorans CF2]